MFVDDDQVCPFLVDIILYSIKFIQEWWIQNDRLLILVKLPLIDSTSDFPTYAPCSYCQPSLFRIPGGTYLSLTM